MTASVRPLPSRITTNVETVSPARAARLLEANTHNRDLKQSRVDQYAADMAAGRWHFNGEPIQFDYAGVLLNGQHRLWAVVESDTTQEFIFVRGLPPQSQLTMDQGTKRNPAEQLSLSGLGAVDNTIAGSIRVYIQWTTGRLFGDQKAAKVNTPEVVEWSQANPEQIRALRELSSLGLRRLPVRPAIGLAVGLRLHQVDHENAQDFFGSLLSGDMRTGSPRLALLNRLRRIRETRARVTDRDLIGYFVLAWNAERQGRTLSKLQRPDGSAWTAATFPEPK